MDVALLVFAVLGLVLSISAIIYSFFLVKESRKEMGEALSRLALVNAEFDAKNKEMTDSAASLGKLHNDQIAKLKSITERIETLELRFHGINPQQGARRSS